MKYIIGNWKMNMLPNEILNYLMEYTELVKDVENISIILAVPYISIFYANNFVQDTNVQIAVQNISAYKKGAYTGDISAEMVNSFGIKYSIIGHSERRTHFFETDEIINEKVKRAVENRIVPIICVGETEEIKEEGKTLEFVKTQIDKAIKDVDFKEVENEIIIAYEPVWAIGTGKSCDSDYAKKVTSYIKEKLEARFENAKISVLYGGSVTSFNIKEFLEVESISGVLVGGASLNVDEFAKITKA